MDCPGCAAPLVAETLEGHLGRPVSIDLCLPCQLFWFDRNESLQLAPRSTLRLFRLIGEHAATRRAAIVTEPCCPRCGSRLGLSHDMQRNTPFQYWSCGRCHGRLISFFDFLREKAFIRPLSPQQIEELRRNVQTVNCSNCGAPIDLAHASACAHCGSPLSMLDGEQAKRLVGQLREADRTGRPVDPALPLELARARREVETAFAAFEHEPTWFGDVSRSGLVGAGLTALARWLGKSLD
jgi:hypothetical protein